MKAWLLALALASAALPPNASAFEAGIDQGRIDAALKGLVDARALVGVSALVYANGAERYFGAFGAADREAGRPMSRDTVVQIFSMTKPLTGVAFMQLYEQGKFGLDDPLEKYLPEFAHMRVYGGIDADGQVIYVPVQRSITLRDITRHTAGFYNGADHTPLAEIVRAADAGARVASTTAQMPGRRRTPRTIVRPMR